MMKYHLTIWSILPFLSLTINAVLPSAATATQVTTAIIEEYSNGRNGQNLRALKKTKTLSALEIEEKCFTKKDKEGKYWVVKNGNHDALVEATEKLINSKGEWQGASKCPTYVKYRGPLSADDFTYIEKWLKLKCLNYFSITGQTKELDFDTFNIIHDKFIDSGLTEEELEDKGIYKFIWLSWSSSLKQSLDNGPYPEKWIKNHLKYHDEICYYRNYKHKKKT